MHTGAWKNNENPVKETMAMVTDSNVLNILELTLLLQNCNLSILLFIHAFIHCSDVHYLHPKYRKLRYRELSDLSGITQLGRGRMSALDPYPLNTVFSVFRSLAYIWHQ